MIQQYLAEKERQPNKVVWIEDDNYVHTFDICAVKTADTLGTILTKKSFVAYTKFPIEQFDLNVLKMLRSGSKLTVKQKRFYNNKIK